MPVGLAGAWAGWGQCGLSQEGKHGTGALLMCVGVSAGPDARVGMG